MISKFYRVFSCTENQQLIPTPYLSSKSNYFSSEDDAIENLKFIDENCKTIKKGEEFLIIPVLSREEEY